MFIHKRGCADNGLNLPFGERRARRLIAVGTQKQTGRLGVLTGKGQTPCCREAWALHFTDDSGEAFGPQAFFQGPKHIFIALGGDENKTVRIKAQIFQPGPIKHAVFLSILCARAPQKGGTGPARLQKTPEQGKCQTRCGKPMARVFRREFVKAIAGHAQRGEMGINGLHTEAPRGRGQSGTTRVGVECGARPALKRHIGPLKVGDVTP